MAEQIIQETTKKKKTKIRNKTNGKPKITWWLARTASGSMSWGPEVSINPCQTKN